MTERNPFARLVSSVRLLGCLVVVTVLPVAKAGDAANLSTHKPNIVFILADDLGYGDVTCFNAQSKIPTPHLDKLAMQGMRFTDAHTSSSVCTPTRYSTLTGRYAWRTHLQSGVLDGFSTPLIASNRMTVASLLKTNGYQTAAIGKWHLGMNWQKKEDAAADSSNKDKPQKPKPGKIGRASCRERVLELV